MEFVNFGMILLGLVEATEKGSCLGVSNNSVANVVEECLK